MFKMNGVSLENFDKAVRSLDKALSLYDGCGIGDKDIKEAFRDACIQRFEYCIELTWKTAMKVLGSSKMAAKPAVREMARNNLISDPTLWLGFIEARNETSHVYDEEVAKKVMVAIRSFVSEVHKLAHELRTQS
jgi:nucleotidyltransferase substrate binding protein (TIGR01987 family)